MAQRCPGGSPEGSRTLKKFGNGGEHRMMALRCSKRWLRSLVAAAFLSRSAAVTCSSSRSWQVACTRRRAAAALALGASASLTRASSRCRRASVSGSEGMTEKKQRHPQEGTAARVWVAAALRGSGLGYWCSGQRWGGSLVGGGKVWVAADLRGSGQRWGGSLGCWWRRPE
jgi:hypothetical protein